MPTSHLPTGTVTFLFTDIEGSTRLVQKLGDKAWIGVLETHNRLLRTAIETMGGVVVKTEGDAFFAVFESAADAVAAAADAQQSLGSHPWPSEGSVLVRMGLHTGVGTLGGDDYVGLDVHRAARIAGAAHGGQTVLSEPTAVLAERDLPEELGLRDLGKHRLKDLSQPETIFELVRSGHRDQFPPLRTLDAIPNNLPMQLTTFIGRQRDLSQALQLLEATRVLTLTGPGGTGKTRLALQIGAEVGSEFRHGVFFVDLAPVSDPEVVPSQIMRSLGIQAPAAANSPDRSLLEHLESREVLLILDNFEQIIAAAGLVADMVRASSRSKFIVTSRGPLRISAEQEMPVQPLPLPEHGDTGTLLDFDAVQLFAERAMAVRPDFSITPENRTAVAELVRRLDGLPLAIELVASRVRLLPVATIVERLDIGMLNSGAVDLPERQRTIDGAIAWSHELLGDTERNLFARFSVFAGGARLNEIEAVCGDEGGSDLLDGLGVLLDQSLLRPVEGGKQPRFRMLQVIREYAAARLAEAGEEDEIHHRHLVAYAEMAEAVAPELLGKDRKQWLDAFDADHDNVRSGLEWATRQGETDLALRLAAAAWRFWQARGHLHEARRRLDTALAQPGGELRWRAKAVEALGGVLWWQGKTDECQAVYREALQLERKVGDPAGIAMALYNLALSRSVGRYTEDELVDIRVEVDSLLDEAETLYEQLGDEGGLGDVAWGRGTAGNWLYEEPSGGLEEMKRSIVHYRRAGNEFGTGWGMFEVADIARRAHDPDTSWEYLTAGLKLFVEHRDVSAAVLFIALAAALAQDLGDEQRAIRLAGVFHGLRISSGTDLVDHDLNRVEGLEFETVEALTGDLAAVYQEGRAMDFDQGVAYTLAGPTDQ
ncbi:MAG: adenylate/guanylate cyclase domain-containing protein [Acidimicrobiia bacterium]